MARGTMRIARTKPIASIPPENIIKAKIADTPVEKLNALYGLDKSGQVTTKFDTLNLCQETRMCVARALIYRAEYAPKAVDVIHKMEYLGNASPQSAAFVDLIAGMQMLKGKFLAMFSAEQIEQATHHALSHGVDMSHDPCDFILPILEIQDGKLTPAAVLAMATASVLGAAHDIIQGKVPRPTNEIESAKIFSDEMQNMISDLIQNHKNTYSENEIAVLNLYKKIVVPFFAREGIVNATYLLFGCGKRDFDNILSQVSEIYIGNTPDLTPLIAAIKIGMAVSDTRRGEMDHLLEKMESLSLIIDSQQGELMSKLLWAAGIFTEDSDCLPQFSHELKNLSPVFKEKCKEAEGFLLILRPNINMVSELATVPQLDASGQPVNDSEGNIIMVPDPVGAELTRLLRIGKEPADFDYAKQLNKFLEEINDSPDGELTFANELGAADKELVKNAERYDVSEITKSKRFHDDWLYHGEKLTKMKNNLAVMAPGEKNAIAKLLYTMAAISPGMTIGMGMTQEIYNDMVRYEHTLFCQSGFSDRLQKLSRDINEIEIVNIATLQPASERLAIERIRQHQDSLKDQAKA
jgi:hypothetical protein